MPLERLQYRAALRTDAILDPYVEGVELVEDQTDDPDVSVVRVEVTHGDLLRAELEADKQKLPVDPRRAPQQTTTLWLWASLVRSKVIDVDYRTFRDGVNGTGPVLIGIEQVRDPATGQPATVEVPPTGPGTGSPSPSVPGSGTSTTGSTPTPTSG